MQRVPVVFWSPSMAAHKVNQGSFRTIDILPTILQAMDIPRRYGRQRLVAALGSRVDHNSQ